MPVRDSTPGAPGLRERKRRQTADHLAATAFALFEAQGYDAVAMEQIAAAADVAKGTLYNYFPVKEALLAHQFRREIAAGMAALGGELARQPDFATRMRRLLKASAQWNRSRRAYLPHYLRFRMAEIGPDAHRAAGNPHASGSAAVLEQLIRDGQRRGELLAGHDAAELARLFEFMLLGAVTGWLRTPRRSLARQFELALDVLLGGIAAPRRKRA